MNKAAIAKTDKVKNYEWTKQKFTKLKEQGDINQEQFDVVMSKCTEVGGIQLALSEIEKREKEVRL